jgi:hypothetical protein
MPNTTRCSGGAVQLCGGYGWASTGPGATTGFCAYGCTSAISPPYYACNPF